MRRRQVEHLGVCALVCALALRADMAVVRAQSALPSAWVAADIGSPSPAGTSSFSNQRFTLTAGGADIWGTSDQFGFIYQQISGDVDVVARVDSLSAPDPWSKAGVMIRADLSASSAHAFALVSGGHGVAFQRRTQAGSSSTHTAGEALGAPCWVRLKRVGTTVTGYSSGDGGTWQQIASATIALNQSAFVGFAVTSHQQGTAASAVFSQTSVSQPSQPLPTGQQTGDIGVPAIAGSTTYSQGVYTVTGAGGDIGGASDQFRYVYQPVTGDVDVAVRVASIQNGSTRTKAGVMVRESLSATSRHATATISTGQGYSFQWRLDDGGLAASVSGGAGATPGWLRLVRTGFRFEAFRSTDGTSWTSMGAEVVPMGDAVYVGIAVTSHRTSRTATAVFDNLAIKQPSAVNQPPAVSLTAPSSGTSFTAPAKIMVSANAADPENRLSRVEFFSNGARIGSLTAPPFSMTWSSVATGTYSLTAVATDADGGSATSAAVTIDVQTATNLPPTVALTSPAAGATFTAPATISLSATASDPENQLVRVEFYRSGTLISSATTAPFAATWSSAPAGTYSLTAVAIDAAGNRTTSAAVTIMVTAASTVPRLVVFHASADDATLVASYRFDVFANGADPTTATPIATSDLGKPAPDASGDITVDRASFFSALAPATYLATVSAIGNGGAGPSAPVTFVR